MPVAAKSSVWLLGSRTVAQAQRETGLSRQQLFALMADGTLTWKPHGGRDTRLIAWQTIVDYLESLPDPEPAQHEGAGP